MSCELPCLFVGIERFLFFPSLSKCAQLHEMRILKFVLLRMLFIPSWDVVYPFIQILNPNNLFKIVLKLY